jgi:putative salt-induced outer membrane protein
MPRPRIGATVATLVVAAGFAGASQAAETTVGTMQRVSTQLATIPLLAAQPAILPGAAPSAAGEGAATPGWSGRGEAGMVLSQGNAQSSTASLKLEVTNRRERWKHSLQVAALRATAKGSEGAARLLAAGQSDLQIHQHAFWFGGLRYESDRFSGFHYQESASTGAGYRFHDSELLRLSAQVGAGYRRLSDRDSDLVATDTVAVAGLDYDQKLGQNTRLVNRTHAESGRYNTLASNYTGVEVQMNAKLGLSAGYDLRHNSEPPPGLKPDDAVSTVHLVYAF